MFRMIKVKAIIAGILILLLLGGVVLFGLVKISRERLLAENLEKGKAMLAEDDYQSARVYLSLFEDEGQKSLGYNLYGYVSAEIAYRVYLGNGDINKLQVASDYLSAINMNDLGGYGSNAKELKKTVEDCLTSYEEQVQAQEQAAADAAAAAEAKAKGKQEAAKNGKAEKAVVPEKQEKTVPATKAAQPPKTPAGQETKAAPKK
ncbi:hypothetical protein SAMN05216584_103197 [Selenomonas sp. WCT3]|uniref:hypothetical protein n=1 Tax=Selenomonas sp. WCT3 TaxID=3158785 RepID=UPI00088AF21A|nr:hypothetical protein SAMN05216584_103197 [Selenomonas ruminantium]